MNTEITTALKLMLKRNNDIFFGPGVAELLEDIEKTGSVRKATETMGLSYSKAWQILRKANASLGYDLVISTKGGINGGSAYLTKEGKELLEKYKKFCIDAQSTIEDIFRRCFNAER